MIVPENASIDTSGHDWACNQGFIKSDNNCIPMTKEEIEKQMELHQAILKTMKKLEDLGVSGHDCDAE